MWLVLFDIDGTLLQVRREPVRRALQEALQLTLQRPVAREWLEDLSGKTDLHIFLEVAQLCGWSWQEALEHGARFSDMYVDCYRRWVHARDVTVLPGVEALLQHLQSLPTVVLGLLTGNLQPIAWQKLRWAGLASFFRIGAFGSDHWERERLLLYAWQRARMAGLEVYPERTIIVGDSLRDVLCARRWGLPCIAVATGLTPAELLSTYGAQCVVTDLSFHDPLWRFLHELHAQAYHCH